MEILKQVQYMQTKEYELKLRRESLEHLCGFDLTDFQIGVLMAECIESSQTIYAAQQRRAGTSTALLLKIYQSIFLEGKLNHKYVISISNAQSSYLCDRMMQLLGQANLLEEIRSHSRYEIRFNNGCTIHFKNDNPNNLIGGRKGVEFFIDNYRLSNTLKTRQLMNVISPMEPSHIHYFLDSSEIFSDILFNN